MNQAQRSFLIKKIDERVKAKMDALRYEIPEAPSLNTYLLHAVMSGNFELRSTKEIKETIRQKALKSKEREDWLGNSWGSGSKKDIVFKASEIFIIPDDYQQLATEYLNARNKVETEMSELTRQAEALKTRIQLASDKILQTMINEVDDMGNISLMDSTLKLLSSEPIKRSISN